jgi:membrane protease YdiL (CAAX protease family)
MIDWIGYVGGFIALVFVFLPHWLDPLILMKERREGWEERPAQPRRWGLVLWAVFNAILAAGIVAMILYWCMSRNDGVHLQRTGEVRLTGGCDAAQRLQQARHDLRA